METSLVSSEAAVAESSLVSSVAYDNGAVALVSSESSMTDASLVSSEASVATMGDNNSLVTAAESTVAEAALVAAESTQGLLHIIRPVLSKQ